MEHWGCVLVSSSLKRCIRPLWNSLLYNYLALYSDGSRGGARGPALPSLRPQWDPKGRKNFFETGPPLISGSGWPRTPYLTVWICHCCKLSRINCHQDWPLWYSSGFSYVLWNFFRGLMEQSGSETPNYGFIKWVGKFKISYHKSRLKSTFWVLVFPQNKSIVGNQCPEWLNSHKFLFF